MTSSALKRAVRANLIEHTTLGVRNTLSRIFSKKSGIIGRNVNVIPIADPESLERAMQAQATSNPSGQADIYGLPVVGLSLAEIAESSTEQRGFNKTAMSRVGATLGIEDNGQYFSVLRGKPIIATYQVTLLTDDWQTLVRMIDVWMSYTQWRFQLRLPDTKRSIKVTLMPDPSMSVPPLSPNSAGANQFRLTTNLRADTYSGSLWKIPSIAKTQVQSIVGGTSLEEALETGGIEIVSTIDRLSATSFDAPNAAGNTELGVFEDDD